MQKIICATDFNPASVNAARYAASMAADRQMTLELVHIFPLPATARSEAAISEMRADAEKEMKELSNNLHGIHGDSLSMQTTILPGEVIEELKKLCKSGNPWLVVMGIEKADAFERFLLGNTSLRALQSIDHALLVVPPSVVYNKVKKIGLACDLMEVSKTVPVKEVEKIVEGLNAELHVIHVSNTAEQDFSKEKAAEVENLKTILSTFTPGYHFISNPKVEKGIDEITSALQLDMMIVIPAHRSFLKRLFTPSHSEKVAGTSKIPLLSLHHA